MLEWSLSRVFHAILCSAGDGSVQSFIALFQYVKRLSYFVFDVRINTKQYKCPSYVDCGWNLASLKPISIIVGTFAHLSLPKYSKYSYFVKQLE